MNAKNLPVTPYLPVQATLSFHAWTRESTELMTKLPVLRRTWTSGRWHWSCLLLSLANHVFVLSFVKSVLKLASCYNAKRVIYLEKRKPFLFCFIFPFFFPFVGRTHNSLVSLFKRDFVRRNSPKNNLCHAIFTCQWRSLLPRFESIWLEFGNLRDKVLRISNLFRMLIAMLE